jgi:hypothetical protein
MAEKLAAEKHLLLFGIVSLIVAFLAEPVIEFVFEKILKFEILSFLGFALSFLILVVFVRVSITIGYILIGKPVLGSNYEPERGSYLKPRDIFITTSVIVTALSVDNLVLLLNETLLNTIPHSSIIISIIGIPSIVILFFVAYLISEWLSKHKILLPY